MGFETEGTAIYDTMMYVKNQARRLLLTTALFAGRTRLRGRIATALALQLCQAVCHVCAKEALSMQEWLQGHGLHMLAWGLPVCVVVSAWLRMPFRVEGSHFWHTVCSALLDT